MKLRLILQIVLAVIIVGLVYIIYNYSIMAPVRFNNEVDSRKEVVIQKLKDIREIESLYLNMHGKYCASFDSLILFVTTEEIPLIKLTARPGDSTFTNPIRDTVGYIAIMDSLFKNRPDFKPEGLMNIPFSNYDGAPHDTFSLQIAVVNNGNVPVNVIDVFAANKFFLKGKEKEMKRYNMDLEDGLRFGSLTSPATDGNWE
jgi:hypothetical protein